MWMSCRCSLLLSLSHSLSLPFLLPLSFSLSIFPSFSLSLLLFPSLCLLYLVLRVRKVWLLQEARALVVQACAGCTEHSSIFVSTVYNLLLKVTHDDEVEALRTKLRDLQQHFRTSLHTQYNQLVQYFTTKGSYHMISWYNTSLLKVRIT